MKDVSIYLKKFLDREFLSQKKWKSDKIKFSEHAKEFISNMIKKIKISDESWKNENILMTDIDKYPPIADYITPEVKKVLKKNRKIGKKCTFTIKNQTVLLYTIYVFPEKGSPKSKKYLDDFFRECLYKVYLWLTIANIERTNECSRNLNIYLYFTDMYKLLPTKGTIIDQENVNGAFTTSCSPSTDIYLFREEEWFKVFIHETMHCFGFDFSHIPILCDISKKNVLDIFHVKSDVNFFETYCELWGEIMNIIFYCYINENKGNIIGKIENYLSYEIIFSNFQSTKVLQHMNITYEDLISSKSYNKYKEKTNVLSYYILKSIFITNINEFFDWLYKNNRFSIDFHKTEENLNNYFNIIKRNYNSEKYIQNMKYMENWYEENSSKQDFELSTLKMVVLEW
jgi:hypothetical protein